MIKTVKNLTKQINILGALLGAIALPLIAHLFLTFYDRYDTTEYYFLETPIYVDKEIYNEGEKVILSAQRKSLIDIQAYSTIELILNDDRNYQIWQDGFSSSAQKGDEFIEMAFVLPDIDETGKYYYSGTVSYNLRNRKRTFYWESEKFIIVDSQNNL